MSGSAFWETKSLQEMTAEEWESLCDGCGRCCLHKIEDEESGELYQTRISCFLLDQDSCRCSDYANRLKHVPDCIRLTPKTIADYPWLPASCAYKRLYLGQPLPAWHPLVSGDRDSVHQAGISVRQQTVSEKYVHPDDWQDLVIVWEGEE